VFTRSLIIHGTNGVAVRHAKNHAGPTCATIGTSRVPVVGAGSVLGVFSSWHSTFEKQPEVIPMLKEFIDCDVVIQAGHENTPDDKTGGEGPLGKEIEWTPVVANEAVRILKDAGVHAVKETAHIKVTRQKYRCKLALFVHFDDPEQGESGPSIGYDHSSDADAAQEWKALYKEYFPYNHTWQSDNFTRDEQNYYGFEYTITSDAELV
jgi:hypothetical protein